MMSGRVETLILANITEVNRTTVTVNGVSVRSFQEVVKDHIVRNNFSTSFLASAEKSIAQALSILKTSPEITQEMPMEMYFEPEGEGDVNLKPCDGFLPDDLFPSQSVTAELLAARNGRADNLLQIGNMSGGRYSHVP